MAGPPPEDPTRRLSPASPPPPGGRDPLPREYAYVEGDPEPSRGAVLDELRALKRWLAVVGAIALAGLGISLYTLLSEDEEQGTDRRGASPARVAALDDRVDELEDRVGDRATKNALAQLEERQAELEGQVEQAGEAGGDTEAVQQSIEQVSADVQALEQRVDELAAQQEQEGTTPP